jgi:hypothetical protein
MRCSTRASARIATSRRSPRGTRSTSPPRTRQMVFPGLPEPSPVQRKANVAVGSPAAGGVTSNRIAVPAHGSAAAGLGDEVRLGGEGAGVRVSPACGGRAASGDALHAAASTNATVARMPACYYRRPAAPGHRALPMDR